MSRAMPTSPSSHSNLHGNPGNGNGNGNGSTTPRSTSGGSFFERFSRRPRTSGGTPTGSNDPNDSSPLPSFGESASPSPSRRRPGGGGGGATNAGGGGGGGGSPSGLPRSSSSSHVHLDRDNRDRERFNSPNSNSNTPSGGIGFPLSSPSSSSIPPSPNRRSNLGIGNRTRPSTANATADSSHSSNSDREREILAAGPGGPSSPNAVGGNPFGRMFRRYSQGAGKNNSAANEAHSIAAASNQNRGASASQVSLGGSSGNGNGNGNGVQVQSRSSVSTEALNRRPTSSRAITSPAPPSTQTTTTAKTTNSNGVEVEDSNGRSNHLSPTSNSSLPASQTLAVISDPQSGTDNQQDSNSNLTEDISSSSQPDANTSGEGEGDQSNEAITTNTTTTTTSAPPAIAALHRIRLVPHLEATRSLHFEPIERNLAEGANAVKIGRFTDRAGPNNNNNSNGVVVAPATSVNESNTDPTTQLGNQSNGIPNTGNGGNSANAATATTSSSAGNLTPTGGGNGNGNGNGNGGRLDAGRVAFKSKVVSRGHAELWCEPGGKGEFTRHQNENLEESEEKFFIRDTRSSSGTFLNHIRLSAPSVESRPFALKDGDVVQLGVDYQGGTEEIYRCVKMRVELNRGWQRGRNEFNVNAMRQIRALQGTNETPDTPTTTTAALAQSHSMSVTDCCICLFSVTVCQSLFIAPCSHVFHYKCIRPLLVMHHPGFSCPLCRTFADLEADVEQDEEWPQAPVKEPLAVEPPSQAVEAAAAGAIPSTDGDAETSSPSLAQSEAAGTSQAAAVLLAAEAQQSAEENIPVSIPARNRREIGNASEATARGSVLGIPSHLRTNSDWSRPDTAVSSTLTARPGYFNSGANVAANHQLGNRISEAGLETPPFDSPNLPEEEDVEEEQGAELEIPSNLSTGQRTAVGLGTPSSSSSRPINIERSASNNTANDGITRAGSPMDESSTPMNQHFFSTLAETSIPSIRSSSTTQNNQNRSLSQRQVNLRQPVVGDTSTSSNSSFSQIDRRGSENSNLEDASFHTTDNSPSDDSPLNDQNKTSSNNSFSASGRQHQPLPRPPNSEIGFDGSTNSNPSPSNSEVNNKNNSKPPPIGKGKSTERRSVSSSSSRVNAIGSGNGNSNEANQQEIENKRDSLGSTNGSAGSSSGGKLSKFFKKAIN